MNKAKNKTRPGMLHRSDSITWEKWQNPIRIPGYEDERSLSEKASQDSFLDEDGSIKGRPNHKPHFIGCMNIGANGIVPLWSSTQADDLFNFWVGHACFTLTRRHIQLIENTNGIEEFSLLTPYRFRIAIARHPKFRPSVIMDTISNMFEPDEEGFDDHY